MCETFNGVMLKDRYKFIISMLEEIRQYVISRIVVKKGYAMKWIGLLDLILLLELRKKGGKSAK